MFFAQVAVITVVAEFDVAAGSLVACFSFFGGRVRRVDEAAGFKLGNDVLVEAVKKAEDRTGKGMIIVDTPIINVDDNESARRQAEATIKASKDLGAKFCFPHHSSAEELVNKNKRIIDRLPDYLKMIRDQDMIPGLSAHMPELVVYSDLN